MERTFDVGELQLRSDGRTVEGRIVPYNEVIKVFDRHPETGELTRFEEQFMPRSCLAMAQAVAKRGNAAFMAFLMEHEEHDFGAKIGYATTLQDASDGAYATFRLYDGRDIDKVRSMLAESHRGLSIGFADTRPPKIIDGVVSRVQVHIDHVAATPSPCYASAGITAMRGDEQPNPETPRLDEVQAWLESLKAK